MIPHARAENRGTDVSVNKKQEEIKMAKGGNRGGYPGGNQMNMIRQAQKMQQEFVKMQEQIESTTFEFTSGGGAVKATVLGTRGLKSIEIDPEVVDHDDVEMLQDLILTAVNGALKESEDKTNEAMAKLQGGMGFPGF